MLSKHKKTLRCSDGGCGAGEEGGGEKKGALGTNGLKKEISVFL